MGIYQTMKVHLLSILVVFTLTQVGNAADGRLAIETGGVQIILTNGWEPLEQPANFIVQKRGVNADQGIALSAGSFKVDLSIEQYTAIGVASLMAGPERLDWAAKQVGVPLVELEKAVKTALGKQLLEQLKQLANTTRFEVLHVFSRKVFVEKRFEVHSKITIVESGQVIYSRQFIMQGMAPNEIVQITYASKSKDVFTKKDLVDAIRSKLITH